MDITQNSDKKIKHADHPHEICNFFFKQEESARERALCQLTECFLICDGDNERKA